MLHFDGGKSGFVLVYSDQPNMTGKIAVLLYRMSIVGNGQLAFYPSEITLFLQCNGSWKGGTQIRPRKHKDGTSSGAEFVALFGNMVDDKNEVGTFKIFVGSWNDFSQENPKGLAYGEPSYFSYAGLFDLADAESSSCSQLKIQ